MPSNNINRSNITSEWQLWPTVGNGYEQRYFFNKNGTFEWRTGESQFSRLRRFSGKYRLTANSIVLNVLLVEYYKGGAVVAPGNIPFYVDGGSTERRSYTKKPVVLVFPIQNWGVDKDSESIGLKGWMRVEIGLQSLWDHKSGSWADRD